MPSQFKGNNVHIGRVTIVGKATGPLLTVEVLFCNADGLTHARTVHELELSVDPKIEGAYKDLHEALKAWVERTHFSDADPQTAPQEGMKLGIAEVLSGTADPIDGVGQQG